jgi:hypothetical protein
MDENHVTLAGRLQCDLPRMRQLLKDGVELDPVAIRELSDMSGALRDSAASAGGQDIARIASDLLGLIEEIALPSHHIRGIEKIGLWYLFFKLKTAAGHLH